MNILIISGDAATRAHLLKVLTRCPDIASVAEADSAEEDPDRDAPDVIIADVSGNTKDVLDTLRRIRGLYPRATILTLGAYRDSRFAVRALQAGTDGYVLRNRLSEDLGAALQAASCGRVYVSPGIAGIASGD